MTQPSLSALAASIGRLEPRVHGGHVASVSAGIVQVAGLQSRAAAGDRILIANDVKGQVVGVTADHAIVLPDRSVEGIRRGDPVTLTPARDLAPDDSWLGRVIDPDGQPLDRWPIMSGPPVAPASPHELVRGLGARIETGIAALNTLFPLVRGQRIGLFAGSGVGKSTLLAQLARRVDADVIVIALVGERTREVREFVADTLGPEGLSRAVVLAATAEAAPHLRRRCADSATRVAEYFRDQGKHVLLLMDSLTRFAEAHREMAVAGGEVANLRGHPPSTPAAIAGLCERAGPGRHGVGDITAIYTVLVAGSDMEEPVADMARGVLDGHIVLDRVIAERGRFPAIDVARSVSRALPGAANAIENGIIAEARKRIADYDRIAIMRQAGLFTLGADPDADAAVGCHDALEKFLTLIDGRPATAHFAALKQALSHGQRG